MFKIMNEEAPNYLINLIPKHNQTIRTRNGHIPIFHCRTDCFKYSFFPSTLKDWFNLDNNIGNSESISVFKSRLLSLIRPVQNSVFNIFEPKGLILLTHLRLGFSHLNEHRFRHNFENCINSSCSCSLVAEDTLHYLLQCHHFSQYRFDLMNSVKSVLDNFESLSDNDKKNILLYGDSRLGNNKNKVILEATLNCIQNSGVFSGSLFEYRLFLFVFYTEYSHPKLNHHMSLIFHAYNVLLTFFTFFIDLYFNILIFPRLHKIYLGHCCMFLLFYLVFM